MTASATKILLSEALALPPEEISEETNFETCESWDSLAHFRVISAIEQTLNRTMSAEEIFRATDYEGVEKLVSQAPPDT